MARVLDVIIIFLVTGIISQFLYGVFYDNETIRPIDYLGLIYSLITPIVWYTR
ncbi:hypothetical protein GT022_15400 [Agaribacter marinus]|nr:hypothetical protein [Agaribacter marinus]